MKKKIIIRFGAEIWNLATAQIVLQYSRLYIARVCSLLRRKGIAGGVRLYCSIGRKLYYNTTDCIARVCSG